MKKYIKLMRVHHYIKNILVFLPVIFAGKLFETDALINTFFGFLAFCFLSSAIYIINDINDAENDRRHPAKCNRPIASGAVSIRSAVVLAIILCFLSVGFSILANVSFFTFFWLGLYFLINLFYSFGLKNVPIVDIAILVSGFIIRVLYGSAVTSIEVSNWLYLTVMSMSFYLGLCKRRNELSRNKDSSRKVLRYYNRGFLDKNMYMCLALTIVFYSLWCVDKYPQSPLVWTVPLVILICMKYSLNVEGDSDGDPVEVVIRDKALISMALIYAVVVFLILYLPVIV